MNCGTKPAAILIPKTIFFKLPAALFHSTPVLERRRRNFWDGGHRSNSYSKRSRRLHAKQELLRNVSAHADFIFQDWKHGFHEDDPSSSRGTSWFKQEYSKGSKRDQTGNQGTRSWRKRSFHFCEDDDLEFESIFRTAFGGNRYFYWSFINDEDPPQWRNTSSYSSYYGRNWRYRFEQDYDSSSESDSDNSESNLASDRLALGLSAYGPLKIEDVKTAYRACALKWHPDRHQGSSKAVAEEKFKMCSAAYQSLCDKLTAA